ncbi:MAG TPA: Ppx/GppA phosphatase family protein [Verrucomicrobiae bacterium]|jgi:exopolyphosphatase/guanosine-5'-triphosphate,3'-diphosphate pyrophosphatase
MELVSDANSTSVVSAPTVRRAVIDIGTNSIKLLVADVRNGVVSPVQEESRQTRLGKNFYQTRRLQPETVAATAEAVWEFAEIARERDARSIRVIATSAARDALNKHDLISTVERAAALKVEIISGEQEAAWAFQGVTANSDLAKMPLLLLDVGGGSTEFILGYKTKRDFSESFPMGTVRLLETFPHSDPPVRAELEKCRKWIKDFLKTKVRPQLGPLLQSKGYRETQLTGTGGTVSILARMETKMVRFDREKIEHTVLSLERITAHRKNLWNLPLAQRREIVGLPKMRADVILTGVLIYEIVMQEFGFTQLRISTRGLRFAAVMD